jgi:hypothetical protein
MKNKIIYTLLLVSCMVFGVFAGNSSVSARSFNPCGFCDTQPWGPGGEDINFCNTSFPGYSACGGNNGGACGSVPCGPGSGT